jgi:hypothetical protein
MALIRKMLVAATLAAAIGAGSAAPASAATGFTGFSGLTNKGFEAQLTATAQADGTATGSFVYEPTLDGQDVTIQCTDFTKYVATHTNNPPPDGFPKTILNATNCFDTGVRGRVQSTRYYVHIEGIDRVGIGKKVDDSLCIVVKLFPGRQHPDPLIKDCGAPQGGDVVINQ